MSTPSPISPERRALLLKSVTWASVLVAVSLVTLKLWGWSRTGSVSLLSSLADSLLDVFASALTFWAVRFSLSPADREHRFGHGKSEGLAALLQAVIISGSALYVAWEAVGRLLNPQPIQQPEVGLLVMGIATAVTIALVSYQHHVSRVTGSVAISADAMHYKADVVVNLGVGATILLVGWTGWRSMDPLVGLAVAGYILRGAMGIGGHALDILLDREIPETDRAAIREIALSHPEVRGFHDMRTRHGGANFIVQFHLELDAQMPLLRSHQILDEVEAQVRACYPGCEIIIHPDPQGLIEPRDEFE
jgi:ferrous-iron efflux pump FieF